MDNKQTAVDFLWTKASSGEHLTPEDFEQAKEMEKEQHKETWFESTAQFANEAQMLYKKDFEQYYNETFKTDNNE